MRPMLSPGQAALCIAYTVTALLCFWAAFRERRGQRPTPNALTPQRPIIWLALALLLLALGWQQAKTSGWYSGRSMIQEMALRLVALGGLAAFAGLFYLVRRMWRRYLPALCALIFLAGFAAVQGISLHRIDHIMHASYAGLLGKTWCALAGIGLALGSIFWTMADVFRPWREPAPSNADAAGDPASIHEEERWLTADWITRRAELPDGRISQASEPLTSDSPTTGEERP